VRLPDVIGVLAALVVGILVIAYLLSTVIGESVPAPTATSPTAPPNVSMPTPSPISTEEPTPTPTASGLPNASQTPEPTFGAGVFIGATAPRISLPALGGGTIDTAAYAGRPLWINFMATWCPQCIDELPMMEGMQASLGDEMTILVIDVEEDPEIVRRFVNRLNIDLPVALDTDSAVQRFWSAYALPSHYFIDGDGVVTDVVFGGLPRDVFEAAIHDILPDVKL
jgi:thiol-disulfide isomerase/thioredoxin